ncbi:hypothetical protein A2G96_05750 [Cupriavidus nantongensis]|uniref:Uncharacterized protein n=1 Tax=Cupriavidus nantongensis TaxID=1796606 RepID=A0A142JGR2_9BURK|nr:hypothetical protein A2G96_05750 [Cupriavidus nantongensis]
MHVAVLPDRASSAQTDRCRRPAIARQLPPLFAADRQEGLKLFETGVAIAWQGLGLSAFKCRHLLAL